MKNLRIIDVKVIDSSNIDVKFSEKLAKNLTKSNISILSNIKGVPDSAVLSIKIINNILSINCNPLSSLGSYYLEFKSTESHPFISLNGTAKMFEDGVLNKFLFTAPIDPSNLVKDNFNYFYKDNIYRNYDDTTLVSKYLNSLSLDYTKAFYDINQVKNENYLSFNIVDEKKVRGVGPTDRLNEESAYELIRVGKTPTGSIVQKTFEYSDFPKNQVTLQQSSYKEIITANSVDEPGKFNINSLIFNLTKYPVIKINKIKFNFLTVNPVYIYNIESLGYQIKDSKYDKEYGFSYLLLNDNQIKINNEVLSDPLFTLDSLLNIEVEYDYKNLGIVVDSSTIEVYKSELVSREALPAIVNIFSLKHANLIDVDYSTPTLNKITFTDPNSNTGSKHPAFLNEIIFRLNALPSLPGQYSVDYENGKVYVYGEDLSNNGTGPYPPLATYNYKHIFTKDIDYTYDESLLDLVALPYGNLIDNSGIISFNYEQALIQNIDFKANLHKESLDERINNNLITFDSLKVANAPVTNVFRIYNETSGELYRITRWNNDKIYFEYNTPPRLNTKTNERVVFNIESNEELFVSESLTNDSLVKIFKILLRNNYIISSTEDCIGSSINSSVIFSNGNVFIKEKYFDNINNLSLGEYFVDYTNGIVYVAVTNDQDLNLGTVTYKNNKIKTNFLHIIAVDDIYYQNNLLEPKNKKFNYTSFDDNYILVENLDYSDEGVLNSSDSIYQVYQNNIGTFVDSTFVTGLSNKIKFTRGIYEYNDLINNLNPLNFSTVSQSSGFNVTVNSINNSLFDSIKYDGSNYYVNINENITYLSDNISYTFSIIRSSDSAQLWDNSGQVYLSTTEPVKLILSGVNSPSEGELVNIIYTFTIKDLSRVVVDYNKGDLFVDYTYLADEIIVSYEYGDNYLDFREFNNIKEGEEYYVSYKAGALRDSLQKNFASLVNIEELNSFDTDFNRERYRDALTAALSSFIQGPTISALKNIGKTISHIQPEIKESIFENWSLGNTLLYPQEITTSGDFELLPSKFGNGALITNQTIKTPSNSNLRLEEGTFETWITPQWNGLDNDADVTFSILKDGYEIDSYDIFIGSAENHPEIINGSFTLNKNNAIGTPNTNKDGVYLYYDKDFTESYDRWYVKVIDGYVQDDSSNYKIKISTNGKFYDSKSISLPKPSNVKITTTSRNITLDITGGIDLDNGITFLADLEHYIFDVGEKSKNRLSLFKDTSGYLVFKALDKNGESYIVSGNVSNWKKDEQHFIACSWKLNSINNKDEMHLFIDGFEVPNIKKYGQKIQPYLDEKYRVISKENVISLIDYDIFSSTDLITNSGSNIVESQTNFSAMNIVAGNTIFIDEEGFDSSGYTIVSIYGQQLTLSSAMPLTLSNVKFSINKTDFTVSSDIDVASKTAVYRLPALLNNTDLTVTSGSALVTSLTDFSDIQPGYSINISGSSESIYTILDVSTNSLLLNKELDFTDSGVSYRIYDNNEIELFGLKALNPDYEISKEDITYNNILTIKNNVFAGDLLTINTFGLNFKNISEKYYVWSDGYENTIMTRMPPPISLEEVSINKIILPATIVGPSNSTLSLGIFSKSDFEFYQPPISVEGRKLSISISGSNVDFSTPVEVTINGISDYNLMTEVLLFSDYSTKSTENNFNTITSISINVKPINVNKNALSLTIKDKDSITKADGLLDGYSDGYTTPVIRYSYHIGGNYYLKSDGYDVVTDNSTLFSAYHVGSYLWLTYPASVAGFYLITGISSDRQSLTVVPTNATASLPLPSFTDGVYQIFKTSTYRSGLQNGFFTLEESISPNVPYLLNKGFYEINYKTYASIKFDVLNSDLFFGSNVEGVRQANAILDEVKVYSIMLDDNRVGETVPSSQRSITKNFNSLKQIKSDKFTLVNLNFDSFPFTNDTDVYINNLKYIGSNLVINDNFTNSLIIKNKPIIIKNTGILDAKKEGTIEFWVSPLYDTGNDPNERYYFDASNAVVEEVVSVDNTSVKISSNASEIISVTIMNSDINYFAGGKLEIDTQNAIQEEGMSINSNSVITSKPILQVISVKIENDPTNTDYFSNGSIGTDLKTIYLGKTLPSNSLSLIITYQTIENNKTKQNSQIIRLNKKLPYHQTKVKVKYIPKGNQGDRLSIFKDKVGYMNFTIKASNVDYNVRAPIFWSKDTWHRVKAQFITNSSNNLDSMKLFLDGYEFTSVPVNSGMLFGDQPFTFGATLAGDGYTLSTNIIFKDQINDLFIGSDFSESNPAFSLIDNFRISNIYRPIYSPYGEPLDVNYSSNLDTVFPVTEDLYTTLLLNFDKEVELIDNFAILKNRKTGLFDFSMNIFDNLDIINDNEKIKEILEKLIKVLKPANSRVYIKYIK